MSAFLFDVDDTLYDQLWPFGKAYERYFKHYDFIPLEELFRYSRKYSDEVFEQTEKGKLPLREMHIYRMTKAFEVFDVKIEKEEALNFQYAYENFQHHIQLLPDIEETFHYCKMTDIELGIITNGSEAHQKNKIKQLGLSRWIEPDHVFISGAEKAAKPDEKIFNIAENKMHLTSKDTYYVGDSFANDVVGAKHAGWKAIWINTRNKKMPDSTIQPDHIVNEGDSLSRLVKNIVHDHKGQ